ncbi:hypothetical protein D3C79_575070 [compost metagenome]
MIAQVPVTHDVQRPTYHQRFTRLLEHAPGEEIAHYLLLMERRVAQHHVQRLLLQPGQAIGREEGRRALAQRCQPVLLRRLHCHVRLVDQGVLGLRVGQGAGDREHAVAAAQVCHPRTAEVAW